MGKDAARARFEKSAERILLLEFRPGLFENPYINIEHSKAVAGSKEKCEDGYNAQLASVVMLKNKGNVIASSSSDKGSLANKKVYIPMTYLDSIPGPWGASPAEWLESLSLGAAKQFCKEVITDIQQKDADGNVTYVTPDLSDVDLVIVGMSTPNNGSNFSYAGMNREDRSFYPLSLQYQPYTAKSGRSESISGDIVDGKKENRSYNGKTSKLYNAYDYTAFMNTVNAIKATGKNIPIVVCMTASNPVCFGEIEPYADAILMGFSVSDQAFFDILAGKYEPRGLLPLQMPKDMEAVEAQNEDVGRDMECYTDEVGNVYDYAYGLNYSGRIADKRTKKYSKK